ncbi:hypothetical protein K437DRAFT_128520 [Tilletiaria anomala UBC 951]|uniref:Uncharacterized protein n=1 Tax=Tilletiaria anomala (strain ATCC 24038 / CBS 436.72 / UBC 951) TaxID=1037660 RepID=A0A066VX98_TILAU|nr:uncharacterized protein K437DRAFT_128520 [Tilletiaria anomala UBC 951]KDN44888.1 hypothetical protein K437DRAFT_128520 [Tilletiaria anomala UBC 951]
MLCSRSDPAKSEPGLTAPLSACTARARTAAVGASTALSRVHPNASISPAMPIPSSCNSAASSTCLSTSGSGFLIAAARLSPVRHASKYCEKNCSTRMRSVHSSAKR